MAEINYYADISMIGSDIQMNKNELQLPVIDNEATAPSSPVEGQMYFDTTAGDKTMYFYNGTAWVEMDGSGSGVSQLTTSAGSGISLSSSTGDIVISNIGLVSVLSGSFIDLTKGGGGDNTRLEADLSATGTPGPTTFLRGDNAWAVPVGAYDKWQYTVNGGTAIDMIDGEVLNFISSTGIGLAGTAATPNTLTISNTGVTSIVAGTNVTISGATGAVTINSTDQYEGTVKSVSAGAGLVKTGTAVDPIISVDYTATGLINDAPVASPQGAETDDYILIGDDSAGGATAKIQLIDIPVNIFGIANGPLAMGNGSQYKITGLADGDSANDAVNFGQVQTMVAGVGLFKGGYNANTGLTTDLTTNGSLDGASNIALDQGDFFVVTTDGTAFYTETLEVGDMIYANQNITASSNPSIGVYTVVKQDANIAGAGATDGNTEKGVSGFNSAHFTVSATGWVQSKIYAGTTTVGLVPSGGAGTEFLRGDGNWAVPTDTNTQRSAGVGLSLNGNAIDANVDGVNSVAANASSTTAGRTYKVQVDSSDELVVNVPWVDTNTNIVTSVSASTTNDEKGIIVSPTTGAVKVGLDIKGLTNISEDITNSDFVVVYDASNDTNVKTPVRNLVDPVRFATTITSFGTVTHNLGSFDVFVQLYNASTKETIQACVERATIDTVAISGNSFPTGDNIRVLCSLV